MNKGSFAEPRDKLVETKLVCFVEGRDKNVGLLGVRRAIVQRNPSNAHSSRVLDSPPANAMCFPSG